MNNILILLVTTFAISSFANADEPRKRYFYTKIGGSYFNGNNRGLGDAAGLGARFEEDDHAIDISVNYTGKSNNLMITAPRAMYLYYLNPHAERSVYVGGGMSFGWFTQQVKQKHYFVDEGRYTDSMRKNRFTGFVGEFVLGYDFTRFSNTKLFTEFAVSQPLVAVSNKNRHHTLPVFTLTCGVAF